MKDSVTITKREYMQLLEDSLELGALGDAGVDNWGGIDEAFARPGVWQITQCALVLKGNLYKCTFSISNQKAMT